MDRRTFLAAPAAALAAPAPPPRPAILELTFFRFRNSQLNERRRALEYLERHWLPALRRAGVSRVGVFSNLIGEDAPLLMTVSSSPSLAAWDDIRSKLAADAEHAKGAQEFYQSVAQGFVRVENRLLQAFSSVPDIEFPPTEPPQPQRVFELRIYESNTPLTLRRKIAMFDDGEVALFRQYGLLPVFFGETIVGPQRPNLTYLVAFNSLADREQAWQRFATSPEWKKMSATPGLSDAEVVSNISNMIVRAAPFSPVR